ncbi:MAG TPA: excinuclease ABC subunit C, partial [Bacteroidetes bacterium]|nr:excinuclease ABC subunit C [Bacteroidota bacterium]
MNVSEFENVRKNIPSKPGVYQFFQNKSLLYVGKAINLRKRVSSYFQNSRNHHSRVILMLNKVTEITFTVVHTEEDALLLENNLIKSLNPRYNIILKDGKSYPFLCIKNEAFPRVLIIRRLIKDGSSYYGPYTSASLTNSLLAFITNTYQIRTCSFNLSESNIENNKFKVCLDYHIGKCLGPCEGLQNEKHYNQQITEIKGILSGKTKDVIKSLENQMKTAADNFRFEEAQTLKQRVIQLNKYQAKSTIVNPDIGDLEVYSIIKIDRNIYMNFIKVINGSITLSVNFKLKYFFDETLETYLIKGIEQARNKYLSESSLILTHLKPQKPIANTKMLIPKRGDKKKLLDLSYYNLKEHIKSINQKQKESNGIMIQLKKDLNIDVIPNHIECFDISHNQGENVVGSLVVYKKGLPVKKEYRHFNITHGLGNNDYESMKEVVFRRFSKVLSQKEPLADLVIIDGGKPQLNAALNSLKLLKLEQLNIFGLAKKLESIIVPGKKDAVMISKRSISLRFLQKVRNEAHRFAIDFHRKQSRTNMLTTEINTISGIGSKTADKLMKKFKTVEKI